MNRKQIFIAYRFTGEDQKSIEEVIHNVRHALDRAGFDSSSSFEDEHLFQKRALSPPSIIREMCRRIPSYDVLLAIVKDEQKSEGMMIEIGYRNALVDQGIKKIPLILAVKRPIATYIRGMADQVIIFETMDDLYLQLESLRLQL